MPAHRVRDWIVSRWSDPRSVVFFRNIGAVAIAAVLCLVPEAGPNRFGLAAFLVFVCVPAAIWVERRAPVEENAWVQPLFDLSVLVCAVHFVPQMWFPALVIGLIVVQAPSVAAKRESDVLYALFASILTGGMTLAAVVHDVPNWELPVLAMVVLYPSVIFYSQRQAARANEIRDRARALDGLRLVAGGVAHDFNNLLTEVMGNADLALLEVGREHPAREPIDRVIHGAQRASQLSARLLAFSGRGETGPELLDVAQELAGLVTLMDNVVANDLSFASSAEVAGVRVRAGRGKFQQLIMNLILNASESSGDTGSIRLGLGADGPRTVRLSIDGEGAAAEEGSGALDAFFTLALEGRSLGLAASRVSVEELGGRLSTGTSESGGLRTVVVLPVASAAEHEPGERAAPITGAHVLVVDDERAVRTVLARMLRSLGHRTAEAADGREALAHVSEAAVDLVLLDLRMPGMDGWTCLRELRRLRADLPVIICSGHDPYEAEEHVDAGEFDFLLKPVALEDLREAVARALAPS